MHDDGLWGRVAAICDEALSRDAGEREAFLAVACGGDDVLRREVASLLAQEPKASQFLSGSALELAAHAVLDHPSESLVGQQFGPYEIEALIGAGGMGVVYRARDRRLDRQVALKVLPAAFSRDPDRLHRFEQEARAAAALNDSNILAVYDVGRHNDAPYLVSELLEGESLSERLTRGPIGAAKAMDIALQLARALAAAHDAGIVHRDVKPANIFLTSRGQVKLLDLGLAKIATPPDPTHQADVPTDDSLTEAGRVIGTTAYMSPEQVEGKRLDARTDVFSFGTVLYEMVAGRRPFQGDSQVSLLSAILRSPVPSLRAAGVRLPDGLERILLRCLEKDPARRYANGRELLEDLARVSGTAGLVASSTRLSRNLWAFGAVGITVAAIAAGSLLWRRVSRERWALEFATPEIQRLVDANDYVKATPLLREARAIVPNDATLEKLWLRATDEFTLVTVPPGADVSIRPYNGDANTWERLGQTPLTKVRIPNIHFVWRLTKEGLTPVTFIAAPPFSVVQPKLLPVGSVPPDMVIVPSGPSRLGHPLADAPVLTLDDYLIDRHEVTNQEYKKFMDAGAYRDRRFWKEPFVKEGRTISWSDAIGRFVDATGRPGPATWEGGSYPLGHEHYPVGGVSWYEAAAYAAWAGKTLPTIYHWTRAAQTVDANLIVPGSNIGSDGPRPVGAPGSLSGFGTTDMAGNVKEWCLNESWGQKRFILGGAYDEPMYMFYFTDQQSPWDRRPDFGFRTVKLAGPPSVAASARIEPLVKDFSNVVPADDEQFRAFQGLYAYDKGPLAPRIEETVTSDWSVREKVTINAAYGGERIIAYVFKPKAPTHPLQSVIYYPGGGAYTMKKLDPSTSPEVRNLEFLVESGRALVFPIWKGQFDRSDDFPTGGVPRGAWRDHAIMQSKDLGRLLDYLGTRKDFDSGKIAYFGFSAGGAMAPILLANEPRVKVAIFDSGGVWFRDPLPEVDWVNFVTRVTIPVLMLNGRYDNYFPVDAAQAPLFRLLGTPAQDKKHILYDAGHGGEPHREIVRESLDWLDKYLGPVQR